MNLTTNSSFEPLKVTFYGGVSKVTGANFLIEGKNHEGRTFRILVDCGMVQGDADADADNYEPFPYDPKTIDILLVTHAHADHLGRVPKLVRNGFRGVIYSTPETRAMAPFMFDDALSIFAHNAIAHDNASARERTAQQNLQNVAERNGNIAERTTTHAAPREALYESQDAVTTMTLWKSIPYHVPTQIGFDIEVYFHDAGHILGSAMIEFRHKNAQGHIVRSLFTGDLGNSPTPLLRDTEKIENMDYVVMESVYGDRNHEKPEDRREALKQAIVTTVKRGGTVLIPIFSLEKAQVLLHEINSLVESGDMERVPVFLDSPLAIKLTKIYEEMTENFNDNIKEEMRHDKNIFNFPMLHKCMTKEDSMAINATRGAKVIIAGSGMSSGGRILHHEKHYLSNKNNTIIFIGYQSAGTLGRHIQDGNTTVTIAGEDVSVQAQIVTISGYSSHKDSNHLVDFVADTASTVKKVFVVMGEAKAALFLVQRLRDELGVHAFHPEKGDTALLV